MNDPLSTYPAAGRWAARVMTLALLASVFAAPAGSVQADLKEGFTIDDDHLYVKRSYPAIQGEDPYAPFSANQYTYDNCKAGKDPGSAQEYMEMRRVNFNLSKKEGHRSTFRLTWQPEGNNLDLYIYDPNSPPPPPDPDDPTPSGDYQRHGAAAGQQPTTVEMVEGIPDLDGAVDICVANKDWANEGYTLEVWVDFDDVRDYSTPVPGSTPPAGSGSSRRTPRPDTGASASGGDSDAFGPTVTPETVRTPGPDGPLSDRDMGVIAAGKQAGEVGDPGATTRNIFLILTLLIVIAGSALVYLRIRRDRALTGG